MTYDFLSSDANALPVARPWALLIAYLVSTGVLYGFVTHFPFGPVHTIAPGTLDRAIPIVPATVPLYLSYLLIMPVLVWLGRTRDWLVPAFFAGASAAGACLLCHLFYPTTIVRPTIDATWIMWLQHIDAPLAAAPSGHIALPVAIAVTLAGMRKRAAALFVPWAVLMAITVLTTGQHHIVDVIGGGAIGLATAFATLALVRLKVNLRTMGALLLEWACILTTMRMAVALDAGPLYVLASLIIASRQHALFILYHDATHYHLTRVRRLNDFLINTAIGAPGLVPVEFYRPLHLAHHRDVGTPGDPERQFLYYGQPWRFRPLGALPLALQLLGDLLVLNMVRNMAAYRRSGAKRVRLSAPFYGATAIWLAIVVVLVWACPASTLAKIAALWFGPLLTLSVMIQKIRSMAEHSGGPHATPGWADWTYSWRVGWIGRVLLWPYHINLHQQHHRSPAIPWHALPSTLAEGELQLSAKNLVKLLWTGRSG
ncbi:MAG: fatty acid desaturase [Paraburkholderia sp.]|jgi:fatty acid desaturase|nr:fatty acid desaturase [Paraburkholderia sp.]